MVMKVMIVIFLWGMPISVNAQLEMDHYISLDYIVRVQEGTIGHPSESIFPRYSWLDDHRLVVPTKKVVEERPGKYQLDSGHILDIKEYILDIDLFILDIMTGKAVKLASYYNISYLGIRQSKRGDIFFISRSVYRQINQDSPGDLQRFHEYDAVNISTLEILPTTRETYLQQRLPSYDDEIESSQDIFRANDSDNLSDEWGNPSFYWGEDYIVALGVLQDQFPHQYDIRLYNHDGSTAYVLPHVLVVGAHAAGYPEILQLSRSGSFSFLNELSATQSVRRTLGLPVGISLIGGLQFSSSLISIYGFTDENPTEYHNTVIYIMDTEDFGKDYDIGEVFEVEQETIDGSVMSTGPANISP